MAKPKVDPAAQELAEPIASQGQADFAQGFPAFEQGGRDALAILQGLIPESLRPSILAGIEAGRSSASAAQQATTDNLVRAGITGSEFQSQEAASILSGESAVASIPGQFTQPVLDQVFAQILGLPQQGIEQQGQATQILSGGAQAGQERGGATGALAGAATGAVSGATLGSFVGPWGTAIGGLVGAGVGAFAGSR